MVILERTRNQRQAYKEKLNGERKKAKAVTKQKEGPAREKSLQQKWEIG